MVETLKKVLKFIWAFLKEEHNLPETEKYF